MLLAAATAGSTCLAQTDLHSAGLPNDVRIASVSRPNYPALARDANISGEVELKVELRKDGSIESVAVVSGPPMLAQAALSSAHQSRFDCQGCEAELTPYTLIYAFQFVASDGWPCPERAGPHVTQSGNRISVTAEPKLVHPYFSYTQARSADANQRDFRRGEAT